MIILYKDETSNSESETNNANDFDSEQELDDELNNFFVQNSSSED